MLTKHLHTENEQETIITIENLKTELTLLHVTDSHMALTDERDPEATDDTLRIQQLFQERTPENAPTTKIFTNTIAHANKIFAHCSILTGDIIHFPSYAAIEYLEDQLQSLNGQYLYTPGNHDWHFPHLDWNEETRKSYYPRFHKLTRGTPSAQAIDLNGVRIIAIDNSNYQIEPEQLRFLHEKLDTNKPCLLFVHIPLSLPTLMQPVIDIWKEPIIMAPEVCSTNANSDWRSASRKESTLQAHKLLTEKAKNLVAIFCGHIHFPHTDRLPSGGFQYVTKPCFEGGLREIRLKPMHRSN